VNTFLNLFVDVYNLHSYTMFTNALEALNSGKERYISDTQLRCMTNYNAQSAGQSEYSELFRRMGFVEISVF